MTEEEESDGEEKTQENLVDLASGTTSVSIRDRVWVVDRPERGGNLKVWDAVVKRKAKREESREQWWWLTFEKRKNAYKYPQSALHASLEAATTALQSLVGGD